MKKLLYLVVLLALLLSACATTETQTPTATLPTATPVIIPPPPVPVAVKYTEVTWFVRLNEIEQKWEIETIIPNFEKKYPDIKISLVVVPPADFDRRLDVMTAAGNPPDIWSHWGSNGFQDYIRRGLVADLTPFIQQDAFDLSDFEASVLNTYKVDGKVMGLPIMGTGSFIFYNKDLFDKAGLAYPTTNWDDKTWTWSKFAELCKSLTKIQGNVRTNIYGCNLGLTPVNAYAWLWGKDFYPESAYKTGFADQSTLSDPAVIAAYQARQDLVWKNKSMPDPASADSIQGKEDIFKSGQIGMQLTAGSGWWTYPSIKNFKWGAAALPYGADGRRDVVFSDPWMLSSKTTHPNEAWTLLKYLAETAQQESWMKATGMPPARQSLAESWYQKFPGMKPEEVKQVHQGALKYGRESPKHLLVQFDTLDKVMITALSPVFNNTKKAADALQAADKTLTGALLQIQAGYKK